MSGLLEKYSQAVRRQYEFHRHLVMQFLPFRAPSMDEYARAEAERRMHLAIGRAVNDAIFDDHVATVTRAINESWLGETLYINLAPFGSPYREDLMEFIGQRIIVRQSDGTWSANYQHRVFQSRPFFSNEYYSRAYDIASRELRSERNRRFSLTPTDQFGAVLYEVVLAGIAVAGATATPLGPRAPAGASRGTAAAGRRFPGHVNQLPADIADDGRMLLGGGTIRDGFAERGVFRITEECSLQFGQVEVDHSSINSSGTVLRLLLTQGIARAPVRRSFAGTAHCRGYGRMGLLEIPWMLSISTRYLKVLWLSKESLRANARSLASSILEVVLKSLSLDVLAKSLDWSAPPCRLSCRSSGHQMGKRDQNQTWSASVNSERSVTNKTTGANAGGPRQSASATQKDQSWR